MKSVKTAYHYNLRGNKYMQEHKEPAHDKLDRTDNHRPRPASQGRDGANKSCLPLYSWMDAISEVISGERSASNALS